jgi:hypothetical protein
MMLFLLYDDKTRGLHNGGHVSIPPATPLFGVTHGGPFPHGLQSESERGVMSHRVRFCENTCERGSLVSTVQRESVLNNWQGRADGNNIVGAGVQRWKVSAVYLSRIMLRNLDQLDLPCSSSRTCPLSFLVQSAPSSVLLDPGAHLAVAGSNLTCKPFAFLSAPSQDPGSCTAQMCPPLRNSGPQQFICQSAHREEMGGAHGRGR